MPLLTASKKSLVALAVFLLLSVHCRNIRQLSSSFLNNQDKGVTETSSCSSFG